MLELLKYLEGVQKCPLFQLWLFWPSLSKNGRANRNPALSVKKTLKIDYL